MSWQLVLLAQAFEIFVFSQCSGTDKDDELTKICCKISVTQAIKPVLQMSFLSQRVCTAQSHVRSNSDVGLEFVHHSQVLCI